MTVKSFITFATGGKRIFKRWLTFRNVYVLSTDVVFLVSLVLRCVAFYNHQCRRGCVYEVGFCVGNRKC